MNSSFEKELKAAVNGEVYFDSMHRKVYSVDASIYEIEPIGVFLPKTKDDVVTAVTIAAKYGIPVIARGAATGIAGGCLGQALILDLSCYLKNIEAVNFHDKFAICQPGVVQDNLNKILAIRNFRLGPDTSTGDRATLGGMMANNSAGARSLYYGKMVDHVTGVELVLSSGEVLYFEEVNEAELQKKLKLPTTEGHIYREVCRIREAYKEEILKKFPNIPRRVSGYNLDELLKPGPLNLSKIITGSEGTLGIATQIKVNILERPTHQGLGLVFFNSMQAGMQAIAQIMEYKPLSLEMIDDQILNRGKEAPSMRGKLDWLKGAPKCLLVAEFQASSQTELLEILKQFTNKMKSLGIGYAQEYLTEQTQIQHVWDLRKSGLGLLLSKRDYSRAIAFIEDLSIDPKELPNFMEKFQSYLKKIGKEAGIYGHVGSGCIHVRPYIDLRNPNELVLMKKIMEDISDMVLEHHGALSGEHGDGIVRTWLNEKMFGKKIYQAFKELKAAFDPKNLMNPGKIVGQTEFLDHLRLSPSTPISKLETFLDFSPEGGFELAADLCNGNGLCRKSEGVMCPSFQATDHEYDSTRARAQALRSMIHSASPMEKFGEKEIHEVLDLCLQCKGCKTECPSQVDMAKMKTEFLYQYQKKHGIPLRTRLFGHLSSLFSLSSRFPRLSNFFLTNPLSRILLDRFGISSKRPLPKLAEKRFSEFFDREPSKEFQTRKVVLFNDTYTEFISPEIGLSAIKVLEKLGYEVIIPSWRCCGRPLLSKGMLPEARKQAEALVQHLLPYASKNLPIVGLEPSCIFTLLDDYPSLLPNQNLTVLLNQCVSFDEFINRHIENGNFPISIDQTHKNLKYHVHCYQKSLKGSKFIENLFKAIPDCEATEIKTGCCGMAGSFGYEKEHYEISMDIGQLVLFPTIKNTLPNTKIIANGFSCRSQIEHGTQRKAEHLAEFLADILEKDQEFL